MELQHRLLHRGATLLLAPVGLDVVVSEIRPHGAPDHLGHRVPQRGGELRELLLRGAIDVRAHLGQVADAVDLVAAHLPLGRHGPVGAGCPCGGRAGIPRQRSHHDAALAIGREQLALRHRIPAVGRVDQRIGRALGLLIEPGPRQLLIVVLLEDRLQRLPELVLPPLQGLEELRLLRRPPLPALLQARRLGRILPLPVLDGRAALGERGGDPLAQHVAGAQVEVVDRPDRARRLLPLLRGGLAVQHVEVARRPDGGGRGLTERVGVGDGRRQPQRREQESRPYPHARQHRELEERPDALPADQAPPRTVGGRRHVSGGY